MFFHIRNYTLYYLQNKRSKSVTVLVSTTSEYFWFSLVETFISFEVIIIDLKNEKEQKNTVAFNVYCAKSLHLPNSCLKKLLINLV